MLNMAVVKAGLAITCLMNWFTDNDQIVELSHVRLTDAIATTGDANAQGWAQLRLLPFNYLEEAHSHPWS
jgi:hypothetical protein